jgi:uncharacterized protein (TIGR03083 family)
VTDDPDLTAAYAALRERVTALLAAASDAELDAVAPATPEWRVRDVAAHLVGVTTDIVDGRLDGVATDAWTEAQVAARRDTPMAEVLAEWATNAPRVEPMIPDFGRIAGQMLTDAATHEHDIRDALGAPGARTSDAVHVGSRWMAEITAAMATERGLTPLRVETDLWSDTFGPGDPVTTLRVSAFELLRAGTGRRSLARIEAYDWTGPACADLVVMPIFTPRADDFDG